MAELSRPLDEESPCHPLKQLNPQRRKFDEEEIQNREGCRKEEAYSKDGEIHAQGDQEMDWREDEELDSKFDEVECEGNVG